VPQAPEAHAGLLDRASERAIVHALLDGIPQIGGALLIHGEAGIGKSVLVAEATGRARASGFRVITATGIQSEADLPFAGLHQLLRPIRWDTDATPSRQRDAMLAAFGRSASAAPDRYLIALTTLDILAEAAGRTPLLVIAEDAQWLDRPTCEVLAFVARRVESDPIAMLIVVRDGWPNPLLEAGLQELHVQGLSDPDAEALLIASAPELKPSVRERLLAQANGNPLALVELPIALRVNPLGDEDATRALLPLTTRLERAFTARVAGLPADCQQTLLVAAVDDSADLAEVLRATASIVERDIAVEAVMPAVTARLVVVDKSQIRFRHPLVRSAIEQTASVSDRRAAHAALASTIEDQPDRRSWHRAAASPAPSEVVAAGLDQTAARALSRGALSVAISAYERAAQLSSDPSARGRRLLRAAELAFDMGRRETVGRLVLEAEPLATEPIEQARMAFIHGIAGSAIFDANRVQQMVDLAERARQAGDPDLAWNILWLVAQRCWWADPGWDARRRVAEVAERAGALDDPRAVAVLAYAAPLERGIAAAERIAKESSNPGATADVARAYGSAAVVIGSFELAPTLLATAVDSLRIHGRLGYLARLLVIQGWAAICMGDLGTALSAADEAQRLAAETSEPVWSAGAQAVKAVLAAIRGEFEQSAALATSAQQLLVPTGTNFLVAIAQIARGLAASGSGRHVEAYEQLRRMFDPADPAYHPVMRCWFIGDLVEAATRSGEAKAAQAFLEEVTTSSEGTSSIWTRIQIRYANALLSGDENANTVFQAVLGEDLARFPFLRGRVLLSYGTWLRRQRRIAESRAPLRAARDAFDGINAIPWAEQARQQLRATGESSSRPLTRARDNLSPQELQIATMAAQGLSNREIGQKLYLSHRTIGAHLYRLYPKLEITSRGQLAKALSGQ
jgi:DNA-binding CsgD family transcriptional regulator/tetratricopeptide (TPR) repeat protein